MSSNGNITYVHKCKNYTTVDNGYLKNPNLSMKAKGLLTVILSLPDDWEYSESGLSKLFKDGRDSVRSGIKELEENNHLIRVKQKSSDGKFNGCEYHIFEIPFQNEPLSEMPLLEKSTSVNPMLDKAHNKVLNNKNLNNKVLNTDTIVQKQDFTEQLNQFWNEYPRKENKKKSLEKLKQILKEEPELFEVIIHDVVNRKSSKQWKQNAGQYIPMPITYLNQRRWEDEGTNISKPKEEGFEYSEITRI